MGTDLTPVEQDYLKAIYLLTQQNGRSATTSDLADMLDIRPASVTGMLQKLALAQPQLIIYVKHEGATLTPHGRREALRSVRQHRLLEQFLVDRLGYTWDEVHEEAERLENMLMPQTVQRIAELLGHPKHNPHGRRIPSATLNMKSETAVSLQTLTHGQQATIRHVQDDDDALLRQMAALGLRPGVQITAVYQPAGLALIIKPNEPPIPISEPLASRIFIKETPQGS